MLNLLKTFLIGKPLLTSELSHQRLSNWAALAVFASDALSSVAYATDEILLVLKQVEGQPIFITPWVAIAVTTLLGIVAVSYQQTIHAYPDGGGAYTVSKENLGTIPSLIAAAALLVDYILTVAVSISAGTAAITSAVPALYDHRINIALILILLITVANLRGVKESGILFSPPVYAFIGCIGWMIGVGLVRFLIFHEEPTQPPLPPLMLLEPQEPLTSLIWLRAFSSGCVALTGIEAISNGVKAFRPPESENAGKVLKRLVFILGSLFLGISLLSWLYGITFSDQETLLSQLATVIFGKGLFYAVIQSATASILVLAANTSFADFPRLASILARDSYLPRQMQNLGDRLCFSNGILILGACSALLVQLFSAKPHFLIPLYAVGVFLSFTLSQSGMVLRHFRIKEPNWIGKTVMNLVGALATTVVLLVVLRTKFSHGAWIVCLLIPALVYWFILIRRHYAKFDLQMSLPLELPSHRQLKHTIILPISHIHRGVLSAIEYARSLSHNIRAVHISFDETSDTNMKSEWERLAPDIPLAILNSPYRSIEKPLVEFVKKVDAEDPQDLITIVIPTFVPPRVWQNLLHNQTGLQLHLAFRELRNVVVTMVRNHLQ
ncbi:MAG: APC family permease [Elusimicrobia bacterium]|nr:APC family permease [Elusimicrobiota bacterium]